MRVVLSLTLCVVCLAAVCLQPLTVHAESTGKYLYEVHDGKATITGCTWTNASYLEIPRQIDGYPVVAVGANAFQERNDLIGLIVSEGIETIDFRAFWCCRNLRWAVLPNSLTSIGDEAFSVCQSLQSIEFGSGLQSIGYAAFSYCNNLFDAELPEGLESIGMSAFYKCYGLEEVYLPNSLKTLGSRAYDSCVYLNDFYIPDTVTSIGANVLYNTGCYKDANNWDGDVFYMGPYLMQTNKTLSGSYTVRPGTKLIADGGFQNCSKLTEVQLPDSMQIIGANAFENCTGLQTISIPAGVTTIGDEAFLWCKNLTDVQFSGAVTSFGQDVFEGTPYYKNGDNWENNVFYVDGCLVASKGTLSGTLQVRPGTETIGVGALQGQTKLTEVILPDSLTEIREDAFQGCTGLKKVTIGKSLTTIADGAFAQCTSLENIVVEEGNPQYRSQNNCLIQEQTLVMGCKTSEIPQDGSVTTIGPSAFEGCAGLQELLIPDAITRIEESAFQDCNNLTTVKLGNGVKVVGKRAFSECDVLSSIDFGQSVQTIEDFAFAYNHQITKLDLPASLQYLGEEVFSNSTGLVSVQFREGLLRIGENCFIFCDNLTAAHLPDSLQEIGSGAFYDCPKLKNLILGKNLTSIGDAAFLGCVSLPSVKIPANVKTIGSSAFAKCNSLQILDLGNVETIGYNAFNGCNSLQQIHVPATVKSIGLAAFAYCGSLEMLTVSQQNPYYHSSGNCIIDTAEKILIAGCKNSQIPDDGSVTIVNGYSFGGCTGLKSVVVPDTVKRIMYYAFADCSGLEFMQLPFIGADGGYTQHFGYIFGGDLNEFVPVSLKQVVITGGIVAEGHAFYGCAGLQEIVLPESIERLNYLAFANCPNLQRVILPGDVRIVDNAEIFKNSPNAVLYISNGMENTKAQAEAHNVPYKVGGMVTILDDQGKQLERKWYFLGAKIAVPDAPEGYTWVPVPAYCTGNQTIRLRNALNSGGDLNGDQEINNQDVEYLLWHTLFPGTYPVEMNVDFNSDGQVNNLDVEYLLWHTLFPETYPI